MIKILLGLIKYFPFGKSTLLTLLLKLTPQRLITKSVGDIYLSLDLNEALDRDYLKEYYDHEEIDFIISALNSEDIFVDIGANLGFYSLMIAHRKPDVTVIAFEPDPYNFTKFEKNIALNNSSNIRLINKGISNTNDPLKLMINTSGNRGGNSVILSQTQWTGLPHEVSIDIECQTLLNAMAEFKIQNIGALKIDIEGYEYTVLRQFLLDAPRSLYPRTIVIEYWPHLDDIAGGSSINLLKYCGYKLIKKD